MLFFSWDNLKPLIRFGRLKPAKIWRRQIGIKASGCPSVPRSPSLDTALTFSLHNNQISVPVVTGHASV